MNERLQNAYQRISGNVPARMIALTVRACAASRQGNAGSVMNLIRQFQDAARQGPPPCEDYTAEIWATHLENDCTTMENILTGLGV